MAKKLKLSNIDDFEVVDKPKLKLGDIDEYEIVDPTELEDVETPSQAEAILHGGVRGATLGFGEELGSAALAALQPLLKYVPGTTEATTRQLEEEGFEVEAPDEEKDFGERYRELRDVTREAQKAAQETHPVTSFGAEVAGGVLPALMTSGASVVPSIGKEGVKHAAKQAAKIGAGYGAVTGLGESEAELTDPTLESLKEAAVDVGVGTGLGASLGYATPHVARRAKRLKRGLSNFIERHVTGDESSLRDSARMFDKIISATKRAYAGEKQLGSKISEELSEQLDNDIANLVDDLKGIKNRIGQRKDQIVKKSEEGVDYLNDLKDLEIDLITSSNDAASETGEKQLLRLADKVRKLREKRFIHTGTEQAYDLANKRRDHLLYQDEIKRSLMTAKGPKHVKVDPIEGQAYYTDADGNIVKLLRYDKEATSFDQVFQKHLKEAQDLRKEHVEEVFNKIAAKEQFDVDNLLPEDRVGLMEMANERVSEILTNPEINLIYTVDKETGAMKKFIPKLKTKEGAIHELNEHRNDYIKRVVAKRNAKHRPKNFSSVTMNPREKRFEFTDKDTGKLYSFDIPDKTTLGRKLLNGEVRLNANDLNDMARRVGRDLSAYEQGVAYEEARDVFKFFKEQTRKVLGDAAPEYDLMDAQYSLVKIAEDSLKPGLASMDKLTREKAQEGLANLMSNLLEEGNFGGKRAFRKFFDRMAEVDPEFVAKHRKQLLNTIDKIDINLSGIRSVGGMSGNISRIVTGPLEALGVRGGIGVGKSAMQAKRLLQLPKTALNTMADRVEAQFQSKGQGLANILRNTANSYTSTNKNAMLFSIMQNPAMKNMLLNVLDDSPEYDIEGQEIIEEGE